MPLPWHGTAAVVGVANTPFLRHGTDSRGSTALTLDAILAAAADAGIDAHDIDGFVSYANDRSEGLAVGAALGAREVRFSTMVWGGGGGALAAAVNTAAIAVATGQATCVAVYRGISEVDVGRQSYSEGHISPHYSAHGVFTPAQICALRTQRMIEVDGVPPSALEALVEAAYRHASSNPDAAGRDRTIDHAAYVDARPISDPLRLFDCSRENDAAGAVLVTTAERARDLRQRPAYVLAGVQGAAGGWTESVENENPYTSAGFHPALVARLWEEGRTTPKEVDVVQVYENFSGPAVASLIDLGLCPSGPDAGPFMTVENLTAPGGVLPVNTAGGNIAEGFVHGIGLVVEAVRQVRGTSPNQVPDVRRSLLLGGPMAPMVSATLFGSEPVS